MSDLGFLGGEASKERHGYKVTASGKLGAGLGDGIGLGNLSCWPVVGGAGSWLGPGFQGLGWGVGREKGKG